MATAFDELGAAKWTATWGPGTQDHLVYVHDFENGRDLAPMTDYRNSIIGYWDETSGVMVELADYNPEGRLTLYDANENVICDERGAGTTVCPTAAGLPFGFNGQWRSETTGFVYMRNRWYSPRLAQFITHDPLEYIDSYNPFTFAALDPINFWDPWGLSASNQDLAGGAGGFAGLRPQSQVQFSHWLPAPLSNDPNTMLVYNGENPCAVIPDAIHCKSGPPPSPDELEDRRHPDAGDVATGAGKAAMGEALYLHCVGATFGGGAVPCAFVAGALQDHLAPIQNEDEALGAAIFFLSQIVAGLSKGLVKGAIDEFIEMLRAVRGGSKLDNFSLTVSNKQFGKKWGKHADEYGKGAGDATARERYRKEIRSVVASPDEVRMGPWRPNAGGASNYLMFKKGDDLVVTTREGEFVTMFKDPGGQNGWWKEATKQ